MARQKLTIKQRGFIREFIDTGNATKSALKVYGTKDYNTAKSIGCENLTKPYLKRAIEELMICNEITDEMLFSRLRAGLNAVKIAEYKGELVETNIPDHNIRHKFLDTILKLKDMYPSAKIESRNINIDMELEKMSKEELGALMKKLYKEGGYGKLS